MAWDSFVTVLDKIVDALKTDVNLTAFCKTLGKEQTVRKGLKKREEILLTELPIIMLTVPQQTSEQAASGVLGKTYTLRLYCGFDESDRVKAVENLIKFEEFVEQALLNSATLNSAVALLVPGNSANDEGFFHPAYFLAKDFTVTVERLI